MKVKFKYGIATYSGTIDQMVYGSYRGGGVCIAREYVYPRLTAQNETLATVAGNLKAVWNAASAGFKTDYQTYARRNGTENVPKTAIPGSSYALFIKMMYAWQASDPSHVDLTAISPEDMATVGAAVATVVNAIELGLLPVVSNYEDLSTSY